MNAIVKNDQVSRVLRIDGADQTSGNLKDVRRGRYCAIISLLPNTNNHTPIGKISSQVRRKLDPSLSRQERDRLPNSLVVVGSLVDEAKSEHIPVSSRRRNRDDGVDLFDFSFVGVPKGLRQRSQRKLGALVRGRSRAGGGALAVHDRCEVLSYFS